MIAVEGQMRFVTLAAAVTLLAAATPAVAQDVDTSSILKSLTPKLQDTPLSDDGSVVSGTVKGIRPLSGAPGAPAPAGKPAASLLVLFASGSADLTPPGRTQLDKLGMALKSPQIRGAHFRIEGHTDTAGDSQSNQALSERRANAVVDYLAAQFGIDRGRLVPVGMGKQGLAVPTPDQTAEPRNRRVVVINLDG